MGEGGSRNSGESNNRRGTQKTRPIKGLAPTTPTEAKNSMAVRASPLVPEEGSASRLAEDTRQSFPGQNIETALLGAGLMDPNCSDLQSPADTDEHSSGVKASFANDGRKRQPTIPRSQSKEAGLGTDLGGDLYQGKNISAQ